MAYTHHKRQAEGMTVSVSAPLPRSVTITKNGAIGGYGFQGLSIKEAEGLVYALTSALNDAKIEDQSNH